MTKKIDEYKSLIKLLELALDFYANEHNYSDNPSLVELDKGEQALFSLKKIKHFYDEENDYEKDFVDSMKNAISNNESNESMIELIKIYKENTENDRT